MGSQIGELVVRTFKGRFVGASLNIQTPPSLPYLARGPLTHNSQNINNEDLDRPRPPFPPGGKTSHWI